MADFKSLLKELAAGNSSLETVKSWADDALEEGTANAEELLKTLGAAESAGMSGDMVADLRKHISEFQAKAAAGDSDFSFDLGDLSLEPQAEDPDKTVADPETAAADNDKTMVADDSPQAQAADSDKTVVDNSGAAQPAADPDKTVVDNGGAAAGAAPDKTVVANDTDRTIRADEAEGEFDPFAAAEGDSGGQSSPTGTGWPTGTAWPGQGGEGGEKQIGPGAILKDRFELIAPIGEGGMGMVYKARDLLKVEAKDKNPFIAVKLLSGDFREHPEAFIALQRESSKAQRLAHPNIATVYDFDRDGSTVYMTMELMEGDELAKYIKKIPQGGLPVDEALSMTEQLCNGLQYAHNSGLVHSDFKPGNCFLLNDGTLKVLDFGIARASKTKADAAGETTVFDPGQLGALTPAYATIEMFEGQDPDPRDDIYALACVAYELLTGKHPFNKLSAPKVLEKGLSPAPINKPGFSKRQNKALMKALALKRDDRTASIDEFWDGLRFKKSYKLQIAGAVTALVLLVGGLAYTPIKEYFEDQRNNEIIAQLQAQDADVPTILQGISTFDARSYRNILEGARNEIIGYYETLANSEIDASQDKYDYPAAFRAIDQVEVFYPDSAQVVGIRDGLQDRLNTLISEETTKFDQYLEEGRLMPIEGEEDITDIIARLRQADPENQLLSDARLTKAYADLAEQAQGAGNYERANEVLTVSLDFAPEDASLLNLDDQVKRELKRQADQQLVAQLKSDLQQAQGNLNTVADYAGIKDQLIQLGELRPEDQLLNSMIGPLRNTVSSALNAHVQAGEFAQADQLLFDFARLFTVSQLSELRDGVSRAEVEAGYQSNNLSQQLAQLDQRRQAITALLADATFSTEWNDQLLQNFKETIALLRPGNTWFDSTRQDIAMAYVNQAHQLVEADRFDSAAQLLDTGESFYPGLPEFESERQLLATAQQEFERERAEQLRLARLEAVKNQVRVQVNAGELTNAVRSFESLKSELPPNDEFLTAIGPQLIGDGFLRQAQAQANRNNFSAALTLVNRGLEIAPNSEGLAEARDAYRGQAARQELQELASNITMNSLDELPDKLREVQQLNPEDRSAVQTEAVRLLATRIKNLESTDVVQANELLDAAKSLFPNNRTLGSLTLRQPPRPCEDCQRARQVIGDFKLTEAENLLASAEQKQPGHEQIAAVRRELNQAKSNAGQYYAAFQQFMRAGQKNQAKPYLDQAIKLWNDNPDYLTALRTNFTATRAPTRTDDGSRPCTANLAGYGRSGRAECFDVVANSRGPTMVVVPGGGRVSNQFAIGKYEISIAEFNAFCQATGQCQPLAGKPNMPATNVSFAQAQAYAQWLSQETGKQYRIPTEAEWLHAASANNTDTNRDFNCRVTQGDQVLKGLSMLEVRAGRANPWGVTNYVGNAQEFVSGGSGLTARGGAFQDNLSNCTIDLAKAHSGSPDPLTGFRVARDID